MSDLPPHDPEAEMGVLSCVLRSPVETMMRAGHLLTKNHFYLLTHQTLWCCFTEKQSAGEPIDLITVSQWLRKIRLLDGVGGLEWLNKVEDFTPSSANLDSYMQILIEERARRKILEACRYISEGAMNRLPVSDLYAQSEAMLLPDKSEKTEILAGLAAANLMNDDLERRLKLNGDLSGLDTGFWKLNSLTEGIQFGEQTLIAARPSMGKTALGLNIFQNIALVKKIPALFVSLEMSTPALMRRLLASYSGISMKVIRRGSYSESDFSKFLSFRSHVAKCPMHILDGSRGLSISEVVSKVRFHVKHYGTKLVVIDYLQKIQPSSKQEKRTYEIGDVSGKLKSLAVETGAAFLTLAQLNRESEKEKGRVPKLADLADSGQIERDADTVALIHRKRDDENGETNLIIAKQRDGECGLVNLIFNGQYCRFENPQQFSSDDVPR